MPSNYADLSDYDVCCEHQIDIQADPEKEIRYVEFDYSCRICFCDAVRLMVDRDCSDARYLTECPCRWRLNRKAQRIKLISDVCLRPECVNIAVIYEEQPVEWLSIAPGQGFPLPTVPPVITYIRCETRTDPGTTSIIAVGSSLLYPDVSQPVVETVTVFDYIASVPFPASEKSIFNIGSAAIYIRNLTTE